VDGQIGLEKSPAEFVQALVEVFREVKRVLATDGTCWINLGDTYSNSGLGGNPDESGFRKQATNRGSLLQERRSVEGYKPKNLLGIPWRVAFALQDDGWYLRSEIIWHKPNSMPESVTDRPTKSHETIFLLAKSERYFYDADSIKEQRVDSLEITMRKRGTNSKYQNSNLKGNHLATQQFDENGRNKRTVWTVATQPYSGSHFATFPEKLIEPCILAGCPAGGTVLDPFGGSGTTGRVATKLGRNSILIELNPNYLTLIEKRTDKVQIKMAM
ncbi:MAG TPA: site-specific DNA-methyltransferase, partial [Candidatus Babeliaceae bacterium]|nr:site-specific DNA-methyltransferase [Candidatus Babeliaceae bacterium]